VPWRALHSEHCAGLRRSHGLPQGREQPLNASRITQIGAGITLGASAGIDAIRAAASEALASPAVRAAAQGFADPNAGARAADLVEKLLA